MIHRPGGKLLFATEPLVRQGCPGRKRRAGDEVRDKVEFGGGSQDPMRVCIDVQPAIAQRAGVGRYTKTLVEHLVPLAGTDEVTLAFFDFKRRGAPFAESRATLRPVRWCPGRLLQAAWKTMNWPAFDTLFGRHDVYHFTNFVIPPLRKGRSVVTIYDMSFHRLPSFAEDRNLRYLEAKVQQSADRADAILTISQFSADEICEVLAVPASRVFPIHLGIAPDFAAPPDSAVAELRTRFGLDRPYLLNVGTIEPRKNTGLLFDLLERLSEFDGLLVLAGGRGWKCEPLFERMRNSPHADRIRYFGFVDDADMPALYAGAELFLFPSFYEGFGLPPLEAMACGAPVIASTGGALPEVLGDGARVLESYEPDAWAEAARQLLTDSGAREALVARGRERAARFTWEKTARATWEVYRGLASE